MFWALLLVVLGAADGLLGGICNIGTMAFSRAVGCRCLLCGVATSLQYTRGSFDDGKMCMQQQLPGFEMYATGPFVRCIVVILLGMVSRMGCAEGGRVIGAMCRWGRGCTVCDKGLCMLCRRGGA